ncbi:hypothetical protein DRO58_03155 [Candidatus Bathyarchaeota archaeon]|nr:MAG: hypothetical protein DRO58_03155 [Candidatus Bathyarchaeota archaeon]
MNIKKACALIGSLSIILFYIRLAINFLNILSSPMTENIDRGVNLLIDSIVPWWVDVIVGLSKQPEPLGGILIIAFIGVLVWFKKL